MKKVLLFIFSLLCLEVFAQTTRYDGNGKSRFGGAIGQGSVEITDKGDSISFKLTKGLALFDSVMVFYIDGIDGGITSTAPLLPGTDLYSVAATGKLSETQKSVLNFTAGFQPDFTVVFNKDGGALYFFEKDAQNNDVAVWGANITITPSGNNSSLEYLGAIAKTDVSVTGPVTFKLVGTYIGANALRSDEGFGDNFVGYDNTSSYTAYTTQSFSTYTSASSLPLSFKDFKANSTNGNVVVSWTVAQETNIDEYLVQRSTNGFDFVTIMTQKASNSSASTTYTTTDRSALKGNNYYRIIIIEKGKSEISRVVLVKNGEVKSGFKVQLMGNLLYMNTTSLEAGTYDVSIVDNKGQLIHSSNITHDGSEARKIIQLDKGFAKGIYRLTLKSKNTVMTQSFLW